MEDEIARQKSREEYLQSQVNELWKTLPRREREEHAVEAARFPSEPQENILYFLEKNAPLLEPWQREIVRIVRKVSQYFYPQKQTQVMNEGWATFWHYTILNHLYDENLVSDRFMLEFCTATPTWCTSPHTTALITMALTPMRWALPCSKILNEFAKTRPKRIVIGSLPSPVRIG